MLIIMYKHFLEKQIIYQASTTLVFSFNAILGSKTIFIRNYIKKTTPKWININIKVDFIFSMCIIHIIINS